MIAPIPPPYGGIANWTLLVNEYVRDVEDVEIINLNIAPKKRGLDGRSLWDRVVVQGFAMFKQKKDMVKLINNENVDVIHMTTSGQLALIRDLMMLCAAKRNGVSVVYHVRMGRVPEIASANTLEWKVMRKAMSIATNVMAIDSSTYNAICQYAPEVNACYVPNPFDMKKLRGINAEEQKKEIVFVGWVVKTKGIEELIAAWKSVGPRFPNWTLKVVGPYSVDYMESLKTIGIPKNMLFIGEKTHDDAMRILADAAAFVLPSYTEGFPNAVLEAMALGKPIIATAVGAIPEMLNGCGVVIPPREAQSLQIELERIICDEALRAELGSKAKDKLLKEYTIDTVFAAYQKVWSEVSNV